jgi:hypothetical protein
VRGVWQMRYAITAAADRLMPCMQCTNTCRKRGTLSYFHLSVINK